MNSTNRILNRLIIFLVGTILLTAGAALILLSTNPLARKSWAQATATGLETATRWLGATPLPGVTAPITGSWLWLVAIAAGIILIALLIRFSLQQGHGHTGRLVSGDGDPNGGAVVVESKVAENAIQDALANRPELVASHVATYRVKNQSVLKVAITCRRGISPRDASRIANETLTALDDLLGRQIPALVQISGGFRARTTKVARLH